MGWREQTTNPKSGRREIFLGQMFGKTVGKSEMNKTEERERSSAAGGIGGDKRDLSRYHSTRAGSTA
jgi:hypothetical protein